MKTNEFERHEAELLISDEKNHHFVVRFRKRSLNDPTKFDFDGNMKLIIDNGTLIVIGDYGDAVYQWAERLTWKWLANMDIHYFKGKCEASENGRNYVDWDSEKAKEMMLYQLYSFAEDKYDEIDFEDDIDPLNWKDLPEEKKKEYLEKFIAEIDPQTSLKDMFGWCDSKESLSHEINEYELSHADEVFGSDLWEWLDCGEVPAYRCHLHLQACKEIYRKLEESVKTLNYNLGDYKEQQDSHVFVGKEFGEKVREKMKLDVLEPDFEKIRITIPENVYSINPSFLEPLFMNVLKRIGREEFKKKIEFINPGKYKIDKCLQEAIERIERHS